jgi:chromosome segregation ATPase
MALPVDVRSIDVLQSVREAFILFAEDSSHALESMASETRRCIDWLTHDQRIYWMTEVKRRTEKLSSAKAELHRKQISQKSGNKHDTEQREAIREAKQRLEEAEDKVENVERWLPIVERAVMEYNGQARPFADLLEFDVQRSIEMLDRMINALEEYTRLSAPETHKPTAPLAAPATAIPQGNAPIEAVAVETEAVEAATPATVAEEAV